MWYCTVITVVSKWRMWLQLTLYTIKRVRYTCFAEATMHWALPLATAKLTLCRSQAPSRTSPVSVVIRRPSSFRRILVELPNTPEVSTAIGSKKYRSVRLSYFSLLFASAWFAAYPGCNAVWLMWNCYEVFDTIKKKTYAVHSNSKYL